MTSTNYIEAASQLQQSQRPLGAEQRCYNCAYWEPWMFESKDHPDDLEGDCRRRAPTAEHFAINHMGNLVGAIAWAIETQWDIKHSDKGDYWFENADLHEACWPRTRGHDWCGDFVSRKEPLKQSRDRDETINDGPVTLTPNA